MTTTSATRRVPALELPPAVRTAALELATDHLPVYVYDLPALRTHARRVRDALPPEVELYYAVKANPTPDVVTALEPVVDGFEVSSGGELAHVADLTAAPLAFGGPGKTPPELAAALDHGVARLHVESVHELAVLSDIADRTGRDVDILLRLDLALDVRPQAGGLLMSGGPTPFGLGADDADRALRLIAGGRLPRLWLRGVHTHLASGLGPQAQLELCEAVVRHVTELERRHHVRLNEIVLGGGMAVDYHSPNDVFDWEAYGSGLARLADRTPSHRLRIEPGRALTAYCGWYVTDVLDVKESRGERVAVVRGGTHHLRTPAAKGHDQPCVVLPVEGWPHPWPRPGLAGTGPVTVTGQLCTPKDVLTRAALAPTVRAGDRVAFGLAGAYAWNISHQDFLMHPRPRTHVLDVLGTESR